jgi:3-hydroxy acid dehydrogenase / malonic semialdehyde reductase
MISLKGKLVCITGASSGIGLACAREFAREGSRLLLSARRVDRVQALANQLKKEFGTESYVFKLDVMKFKEVEQAFSSLPAEWKTIDILVNNAGLSRGLDKLFEGKIQDWEEMIDTNIKGLLYVTRQVLPAMVARNSGHVINLGSIAGRQVYPGGNVYCASKSAANTLSPAMRMDLLGTNIRVSSIEPGLVETEFSKVRFHGDTERAANVYAGTRPLMPEDVAEVVIFCAMRPPHVDISEVTIMPTDQASVHHVHRTQKQ